MVHPLFCITIALCLGIIIASQIRLIFFWLYIVAVILFLLCIFLAAQGKKFRILLLLLCFLLGALLSVNSRSLARNHLLRLMPYAGKEVFLEGVVINSPQARRERVSFLLNAEKLKADNCWHRVSGRVLVRLSGSKKIFYADRLMLQGRLRRPFYFPKPGRRNPGAYLENKGIYFILNVKINNPVKKIDSRSKGNPLIYCAYKIRQRLKEVSAKNLSSLSGSVLNALLLGLRQELPKDTAQALINTGTVHIIAISGLHLGIFVFIVLIFLKALRLPRLARYFIAIITLWGYCLMTGSNLPAVRAAIMATVFLAGLMIRRQPDTLGSLSLAALLILTINPGQLFEVSFQLSFLSIISLLFITPRINAFLLKYLKKGGRVKPLVNIFSASLGAWLGLSPLILYYFRIISPVAILGNMVIVPYLALVIACGVTLLLAGLFVPALVPIFSPAAELSILFLLKFINLLAGMPLGHFCLS